MYAIYLVTVTSIPAKINQVTISIWCVQYLTLGEEDDSNAIVTPLLK
jgi:hypothetical protein